MDVLPLDKRKNYVGVLKNGIQSERYDSILSWSTIFTLIIFTLILFPRLLLHKNKGYKDGWNQAACQIVVGYRSDIRDMCS